MTYVSGVGEEGPPSPASNAVLACDGQTIDLSSLPGVPAGSLNITHKRIYRTFEGVLRFVVELPVATTTYSDSFTDQSILENEDLITATWVPPVADLKGLVSLPGGGMAGFSKNDLYFFEPYYPYAAPIEYSLSFNSDIVGIASFNNNLVVTTNNNPYMITGHDPSSMSQSEIDIEQSCSSKRSMVALGEYGVAYASPDGLIVVGIGGARNLTDNVIGREAWQALNPSSMHAYLYNGRYIAFYSNSAGSGGFIINPASPDEGVAFLDFYATGGHVEPLTDSLYLIINNNIEYFEGGDSLLSYDWKSKIFRLPRPNNFGACEVIADTYSNLHLQIYAGGDLVYNSVVTTPIFRLPAGFMSDEWEARLTGTDNVTSVTLANSISELSQ